MMNAAVFLDRDNTIIANDGDLGDPDQVKLLQGAASAVASLRGLGYRIIVVTNQGGVARGAFTESDVNAVNQRINDLIRATSGVWIDRFYYCPYHPQGKIPRFRREHPWRKPQPGMLLQAAKDLQLDLRRCWMVGDQMRDVEAGVAAGVRTILLSPDAREMSPIRADDMTAAQAEDRNSGAIAPNYRAKNLIEAVRVIAQQRRPDADEPRSRLALTARWSGHRHQPGEVRKDDDGDTGEAAREPAREPKREPTRDTGAAPAAAIAEPARANPATPATSQPKPVSQPGSQNPDQPNSPRSTTSSPAPSAKSPQTASAPATPPPTSPSGLQRKVEPASSATPADDDKKAAVAPAPKSATSSESVDAKAGAEATKQADANAQESSRSTSQSVDREAASAAKPTTQLDAQSADAASSDAEPGATKASGVAESDDGKPAKPTQVDAADTKPAEAPARPVRAKINLPTNAEGIVSAQESGETLLRQILQELRSQRPVQADFSATKMFAIMLQVVALVCLVAAMILSRDTDVANSLLTVVRWTGAGILLQLTTIAALLFGR